MEIWVLERNAVSPAGQMHILIALNSQRGEFPDEKK
jgi:hypothetical protein